MIEILSTKLFIPRPRTNLVSRPRLVNRLNAGQDKKLTLIAAPAGFGKTTLLSEWIPRSPRCVTWLSLDEGDNSPARFWMYFIAALQTISPELGRGVEAFIPSLQPHEFESILTILINDITAFGDSFVHVFDDYHRIDNPEIDREMAYLIDHQPSNLHLIIATRENPQLPLARLRARDQFTELRASDLRFTTSEAAEFLHAMSLNLSADDIRALEDRTEGWVAGLQLAALALGAIEEHKEAASFIKSFTGTHYFVMDYLIDEVLQQQSEKVQQFLLRTAILDRLCGPLCNAVVLDPSTPGQETLEYLECANLFIIPLDNERRWYRYHHLFADLLLQRLGQGHTPEEIAQYHISASEWFEKNGVQAEEFRHLIAAREYGRAAGLAERSWQGMHESFQSAVWLGWVKHLPEAVICSRPVLCTQIAWAFMDAHEVDASESRLQDAERCLEGPSDDIVIVDQKFFRSLRARIAFARAYNGQTRRDFPSAIKYADLAYKLIPEENQNLRAQTTAILGATYLINGDLDAACRSMNDWIDNSLKVGNYYYAFAYAMAEKADILTAQGHLREALITYTHALELAAKHDSGILRVMAHHYLGMAMLHHEMGDDQAADQHLQKSIELAGFHMSVDWSYRRCVAQARMKESAGELEAAIELLDETKRFYIKTLMPHARPIDAIKARIYLKQGRLSKAQEWVKEQGLSVDDELSYLREYEHITLARVLVAEYQNLREECAITEALSLLARLLIAAKDKKRMGSMLEILVTQALAYQAQGSTSQALATLEGALTLAETEGYLRIFLDEGPWMKQMLGEAAAHGVLPGYTGKLLAAFDADQTGVEEETPPSSSRASRSLIERVVQPAKDTLVEPLSQRELEVLRLFKTELSGPEIAHELVIALSTVRTHTKGIYSKLSVNNRRAAVTRAIELGLI
jgi:LuxR family transcriptional regulator, maltose regulon positive regulatory protein